MPEARLAKTRAAYTREPFVIETAPGKFVPEIDPVTRQPTGRAKTFVLARDILAYNDDGQ